MQVHTFTSTRAACAAARTDDAVRDGDIVDIPSEHVVGVVVNAKPVAVTKEHGSLRTFADDGEAALARRDRFASFALADALAYHRRNYTAHGVHVDFDPAGALRRVADGPSMRLTDLNTLETVGLAVGYAIRSQSQRPRLTPLGRKVLAALELREDNVRDDTAS